MTDLEQELIFGESLHWFEKVGGEGELMAQLLLTGEQDGMIVPHLRESTLGTLHVLTIPAIDIMCYELWMIKQEQDQ